jgi:hypothetical protein
MTVAELIQLGSRPSQYCATFLHVWHCWANGEPKFTQASRAAIGGTSGFEIPARCQHHHNGRPNNAGRVTDNPRQIPDIQHRS